MLVQDGNTLGSWPGPGNGLYMFNPIYVQAGAWGTVCGDWVWNNNSKMVMLSRFVALSVSLTVEASLHFDGRRSGC